MRYEEEGDVLCDVRHNTQQLIVRVDCSGDWRPLLHANVNFQSKLIAHLHANVHLGRKSRSDAATLHVQPH